MFTPCQPRTALALALVLGTLPGCRSPEITLWRPATPPAADALSVRRVEKIAYVEGKDADDFRHRLDVFVPKGKKDFPVVVLVHGGAWMVGDNRCCGLYSSVGEFLASRGIGAVLPNYRLSPAVKHPEHMKDLARAVAWTKAHIADYGGRPDQIFLLGHSAGGHMVALLATDEQYLKAVGLKTADIKGVIAVSGVYRVPAGKYEFALGGSGPDGLRPTEYWRCAARAKPDCSAAPAFQCASTSSGRSSGTIPRHAPTHRRSITSKPACLPS